MSDRWPTRRPPRGKPYNREKRRSNLLTVVMWLCVLYFVVPLIWLVISSTKNNSDLFSTFGLWFGRDFSLFTNIIDVFTYRDGIYARWALNTALYAGVSAIGATLLATMAGYAFAKYRFPGSKVLFSITLGAIMIPLTALAIPTYLLFSSVGLTNTPWAVILPVAREPVRRVPHARLRGGCGAGLAHRGRADGWRGRVPDLLAGGHPAPRPRHRHGVPVRAGRDLEQLLPAAHHAQQRGSCYRSRSGSRSSKRPRPPAVARRRCSRP